MHRVFLSGTGAFFPPDVVTTEELVESYNTHIANVSADAGSVLETDCSHLGLSDSNFIHQKSGIYSRRVVNKSGILDQKRLRPVIESRSDEQMSLQAEMAVNAGRAAIHNAKKMPSEVDTVILACSNIERPYPGISVEVQKALGIEGFAYDMNAACASASFSLAMAYSLVKSNISSCVLVVNPELYSCQLNFRDRRSHFIFGDGASAAVVEKYDTLAHHSAVEILDVSMKTSFSNSIRNNYGFLDRCKDISPHQGDRHFRQDGRRVREEIVPFVVNHVLLHLSKNNMRPASIKQLWLHQANIHINRQIAEGVLGKTPTFKEAPCILEDYGNVGAPGALIAFNLHNQLACGEVGVLSSFGAGYGVGSVILRGM